VENELKEVTLETLGAGVAGELFAKEFAEVLQNIADPNTAAEATRSITLTFKIKPSEDRSYGKIEVSPSKRLAPIKSYKTNIHIVGTNAGAKAYTDHPKQGLLPGVVLDIKKGKEA